MGQIQLVPLDHCFTAFTGRGGVISLTCHTFLTRRVRSLACGVVVGGWVWCGLVWFGWFGFGFRRYDLPFLHPHSTPLVSCLLHHVTSTTPNLSTSLSDHLLPPPPGLPSEGTVPIVSHRDLFCVKQQPTPRRPTPLHSLLLSYCHRAPNRPSPRPSALPPFRCLAVSSR